LQYKSAGCTWPCATHLHTATAEQHLNATEYNHMEPPTCAAAAAALGEVGADVLAEGPAYPQMGHLTHMPSHSYLRTGRWHDAVASNKQALHADEAQATKWVAAPGGGHLAAGLLQAGGLLTHYCWVHSGTERCILKQQHACLHARSMSSCSSSQPSLQVHTAKLC
jgi:hypothetical protein